MRNVILVEDEDVPTPANHARCSNQFYSSIKYRSSSRIYMPRRDFYRNETRDATIINSLLRGKYTITVKNFNATRFEQL